MWMRACCIDIKQIGVALKELFSTGVVHRSEIFITSKLWYVFIILPDKWQKLAYIHVPNYVIHNFLMKLIELDLSL